MTSYEDLQRANETIKTTSLEHKNKRGEVIKTAHAPVNERIKAFRSLYPQGYITTAIQDLTDEYCVFMAVVGYYSEDGHPMALGSATAREEKAASYINKTSYVENCETSAVGRALGMAGFGIDTSVASAEEMEGAFRAQETITAPQIGRDLAGFTELKKRLEACGMSESEAKAELLKAIGDPKTMNTDEYKRALIAGDAYVRNIEENREG